MTKVAIEKTDAWLRDWVIELNLCPFARHAYEQGKVDIVTGAESDVESVVRFVGLALSNAVRVCRRVSSSCCGIRIGADLAGFRGGTLT